jgi:DivIVA domain-containing protein
MAESERRQRVINSTPRLSPEEVANRAFGSGFRGYAETEVRSFLRRVSEDLVAARDREEQLLAVIDDLEDRLNAPKPLDEQELLDVLGEETARLLRTAREASDDIRRKAEERSASVMDEAQTEAHRLRTEADDILGVRTQEAEGVAAEIVREAEARAAEVRATNDRVAEEQRERAGQEAETIVEDARQQGRAMLEEARSARERVLADLGRRRSLLQAQVEELRQGRDRLLEAYRVVKRTFLDATEALAQVEARAAAERAHAPTVHSEETEMLALEAEAIAAAEIGESETLVVVEEDVIVEVGGDDARAEDAGDASDDDQPTRELADVDSLFAKIRAGQGSDAEPLAAAPAPPAGTDEPARVLEAVPSPGPGTEAAADEGTEATAAPEAEPDGAGGTRSDADSGSANAADRWRARHTAAVEPLLGPLLKQAKRTAQDDQNALLDAVRRHKGRPAAAQVLRDEDAVVSEWSELLQHALDESYTAGRAAVGADQASAPAELTREAAETVAVPLRERLSHAIDDVDVGDTSGLVERIGARYREWKNQQLERALGDVLVVAWARGVYDGVDDGTTLQWIPITEGHCADCDDNALEPTLKGEEFPTGQVHPPAHPGCRCLLVPSELLDDVHA